MYLDEPIRKYLDDLAAKRQAPGGGSAAALMVALGTSLMSMVANYTIGKSRYKSVEGRVAAILVALEKYRASAQNLIDKDVDSFNRLSEALLKYKKGSREVEDALKEATEIPFEVSKIASECIRLCKELAEIGNENLITDTAIAAILLEGAFFSAKFNVYENLKNIEDMEYIGSLHKFLAPLEEEMPKLKEEILHRCEEVISK